MATDNKHVACYLPSDIEQQVTQYAQENGITRKDKNGEIKPRLGSAVVEILREYFTESGTEYNTNKSDTKSYTEYNTETTKKNSDAITFDQLINYLDGAGLSCSINFSTPNQSDRESEEMLEDTKISEGDVGTSHPEVKDTRTDLGEDFPYPPDEESGLDSNNNNDEIDQDATEELSPSDIAGMTDVKDSTIRGRARARVRKGKKTMECGGYEFEILGKDKEGHWKFKKLN